MQLQLDSSAIFPEEEHKFLLLPPIPDILSPRPNRSVPHHPPVYRGTAVATTTRTLGDLAVVAVGSWVLNLSEYGCLWRARIRDLIVAPVQCLCCIHANRLTKCCLMSLTAAIAIATSNSRSVSVCISAVSLGRLMTENCEKNYLKKDQLWLASVATAAGQHQPMGVNTVGSLSPSNDSSLQILLQNRHRWWSTVAIMVYPPATRIHRPVPVRSCYCYDYKHYI